MKNNSFLHAAMRLNIFFAMAFLPGTALSDTTPDAISEIRHVYKQCQTIRKANSRRETRYFADYGDLTSGAPPIWSRTLPKDGAYSDIKLIEIKGKIRAATRHDTSPSGDWSKIHDYCYRKDGSLAFIFAELRTFHGNRRVEDRIYFDPDGKNIRSLRYVFDLETGKRLDDKTRDFMDQKMIPYLTTGALRRLFDPTQK